MGWKITKDRGKDLAVKNHKTNIKINMNYTNNYQKDNMNRQLIYLA